MAPPATPNNVFFEPILKTFAEFDSLFFGVLADVFSFFESLIMFISFSRAELIFCWAFSNEIAASRI